MTLSLIWFEIQLVPLKTLILKLKLPPSQENKHLKSSAMLILETTNDATITKTTNTTHMTKWGHKHIAHTKQQKAILIMSYLYPFKTIPPYSEKVWHLRKWLSDYTFTATTITTKTNTSTTSNTAFASIPPTTTTNWWVLSIKKCDSCRH